MPTSPVIDQLDSRIAELETEILERQQELALLREMKKVCDQFDDSQSTPSDPPPPFPSIVTNEGRDWCTVNPGDSVDLCDPAKKFYDIFTNPENPGIVDPFEIPSCVEIFDPEKVEIFDPEKQAEAVKRDREKQREQVLHDIAKKFHNVIPNSNISRSAPIFNRCLHGMRYC